MKDTRTNKELADKKTSEQASKHYKPPIISLEEIKELRRG